MNLVPYICHRNIDKVDEMTGQSFQSHSDLLLIRKCFNIFCLIVDAVHYVMLTTPKIYKNFLSIQFFYSKTI